MALLHSAASAVTLQPMLPARLSVDTYSLWHVLIHNNELGFLDVVPT